MAGPLSWAGHFLAAAALPEGPWGSGVAASAAGFSRLALWLSRVALEASGFLVGVEEGPWAWPLVEGPWAWPLVEGPSQAEGPSPSPRTDGSGSWRPLVV